MQCHLTVDGPDGLVVYDSATLAAQAPNFVSEYQQGKVTQPNASLHIPETFLGVDGDDLLDSDLEGAWRAIVRLGADGPILADGRITREGIEWDAVARSFIVEVIADAADEAKRRLRMVRLNDLPQAQYDALVYREHDMLYPGEFRKRGAVTIRNLRQVYGLRWYNLLSVAINVCVAADLLNPPAALYDLVTRMQTSGTDYLEERQPVATDVFIFSMAGMAGAIDEDAAVFTVASGSYTRNSLTLPAWTGWELMEGFCKLAGLTFDAAYEEFPGTSIVLDLLPDLWAETEDLPVVDDLWNKNLYTVRRTEAQRQNLAVVTGDAPPYPDLITWGTGMYNVDADVPVIDPVFQPPALATRAADRWVFDANGAPLDQTEVKLPFTVAPAARAGNEEFVDTQYDTPGGLAQTLIWGDGLMEGTDDKRCYIASTRASTQQGILLYRRLVNAGFGQQPNINEVWAREVFANYTLSRVPRDVVEGTLNVSDLSALAPGRLDGGVQALGRPWMVERVERRTELQDLTVKLARPAATAYPTSDEPYYTGAVTDLSATYVDIEVGSPEKEYVRVQWSPPGAAAGRALLYEVERYSFNDAEWQTVAYDLWTGHVFDFDREYEDGSLGREDRYRVRAYYIERQGIPVTYGPWTEVSAYE